jgi:hypothetical protein
MVRATSIALGIGLLVLWIVGLSHRATPWLTWMDGVAALAAFGIAGSMMGGSLGVVSGGPMGLGIALGVLWIIGLARHDVSWLVWWTFAFGCAFVLLGIASAAPRTTHPTTAPPTRV